MICIEIKKINHVILSGFFIKFPLIVLTSTPNLVYFKKIFFLIYQLKWKFTGWLNFFVIFGVSYTIPLQIFSVSVITGSIVKENHIRLTLIMFKTAYLLTFKSRVKEKPQNDIHALTRLCTSFHTDSHEKGSETSSEICHKRCFFCHFCIHWHHLLHTLFKLTIYNWCNKWKFTFTTFLGNQHVVDLSIKYTQTGIP